MVDRIENDNVDNHFEDQTSGCDVMGPMILICDDGLEMCIWEGYRQFHCLFSLDPLWLEKYKLTLFDEIVFSYLSG